MSTPNTGSVSTTDGTATGTDASTTSIPVHITQEVKLLLEVAAQNDTAKTIENLDLYTNLLKNVLAQQKSVIQNTQNNAIPDSAPASQPSWNDPQIHISSASGNSVSNYPDICDFVQSTMVEEEVISGSPLYEKATKQILKEIENDIYVICDTPPEIISPMAAIPKPDGDVRFIHDCSRPSGKLVNDYCSSEWKQKFSRVDDAASLMTEGCFFAKVDLKSA